MTLLQIFTDFQSTLALNGNMIAVAHSQDAAGAYIWNAPTRAIITEAAFLKNFVAWESFLEKSFVAYMMGELSVIGNAVTRYVQPMSHDHANLIAKGVTSFVDWSTPDTVRKLANLYFDNGEPFETVLVSIRGDLLDLKTIRNAAAHISSTTASKLDNLSTRKLGRPVVNTSVFDLILTTDPNSPTGNTIFQTYMIMLDAAAHQIANI